MPPNLSGANSSSQLTPTSSRGLFPQTPAFSLDTFSDRDFVVKDFVENLSEYAAAPNRRSGPNQQNQAFDPKPLIRSFEHALDRMADLSGELELRENELSAAVRRAEAHYANNIQSLGQKLDATVKSFDQLDSTLSGKDGQELGESKIVKVGERLEELDRQRKRALDAKFLMQCWLEVKDKGELYRLEELRRSGKGEGKVKCANIARQLLKISQRLEPDIRSPTDAQSREKRSPSDKKWNCTELIEKFLETLENDLLRSFDDAYRRQNFDVMHECARALHDFNDGASVIAAFVNQHTFFIDRRQLVAEEIEGEADLWEQLADPDASPPGVESSLQSLVDEVRLVMIEESQYIKQAFPYAEQVVAKFIQRIFQQSIQQKLELILEKASSISSLAFLRCLQTSRSAISNLIDTLKAHGLTEHPDSVSPNITMVLDQQFDDLFVPYMTGSSYMEREKRSLEELYSSLLFKFTIYHTRRRKQNTTFMKSLAKSGSEMLASARDAYVDRLASSDLAPAQKKMLLRVAGLKDVESAKGQAEIEIGEEDGLLSTDNAKRMLRWLAEAVGRGLELSNTNESAKDVAALQSLLLTHLGQIYIETSLDTTAETAASQESTKIEPDLSYLLNTHAVIGAMHLLLASARNMLIPLSTSNVTVRRDMEKSVQLVADRMDEKLNAIMHRTIDVVMNWTIKLLGAQKKTDYRPRDDIPGPLGGSGAGASGSTSAQTAAEANWLNQLQTPACLSVYLFLVKVGNVARVALSSSSNLTGLMTEIAFGLRAALLDHFKKFPVSAAGGLLVTKDMSKYVELLKSWSLDPVAFQPTYDALTEIGTLFVIGPEALKERLRLRVRQRAGSVGAAATATSTAGVAWDASDLKPYVLRRDDASSVGVQAALSAI